MRIVQMADEYWKYYENSLQENNLKLLFLTKVPLYNYFLWCQKSVFKDQTTSSSIFKFSSRYL